MSDMRIAIDGPSGSGKSTLGKALAERLKLPYVDTGAMYRAVASVIADAGIDGDAQIVDRIQTLDLEVDADPGKFRVRVDGLDVTDRLRHPDVSKMAAKIAAIEGVRAWLLPRQRAAARHGGVLEGRDIGAVVLPDADYKFYITSDESTRMARRAKQLGLDPQGAEVVNDVRQRDRVDSNRKHSPLRAASDAVRIDTSGQTVAESLAEILRHIGLHG